MAKNIDVIHAFIDGEDKPKTANLRIEDNKLINYNTVIAERNDESNDFIINVTKYSSSTTRIQNALITSIDLHHRPMTMDYVYDVEIGARSLQ